MSTFFVIIIQLAALLLICNSEKRLVEATRDPRAGEYLAQRISIAIQRGNAASVLGTLPTGINMDQLSYLRTCNSLQLIIRYIATEHPAVDGINNKYVFYANLTSRRYGRKDPFYYVGLNMEWQYEFHNNVTVSFYFYEFLTNRYKRSFVEMHWKFCDLIWKDKIFGTALRQGPFNRPCPFPAGPYNLSNMTIPLKNIPANFPFKKGRIYCNVTVTASGELIGRGHINMEIKEIHTDVRNWVDKQ